MEAHRYRSQRAKALIREPQRSRPGPRESAAADPRDSVRPSAERADRRESRSVAGAAFLLVVMSALDFEAMLKMERAKARKAAAVKPQEARATKARPAAPPAGRLLDGLPPSVTYYAEFVTPEEENSLIAAADAETWVRMPMRCVQSHGGTPSPHEDGMLPEELPVFLQDLSKLLVERGG